MLKFLKLAQLRLKSSISNESFRTQSGYFAALSLVGTLLSLLVVFTRRDGMGGDEAGYLNYSFATMVGDSPTSGKPPLFYFANYFFRHSLEDIFGRIAFVSPYFVYALLFSISLSFLAFAISRLTNSKIWQVFALLWLSPLAFYHSTHLMMETPLFILINFIVGICIFSSMDVNRPALSLRMVSLSFLVALAVMIKETTLPALILIFCGVVFTDRIHKKYFIYGIFLGILLRILINHFMGAADAQYLNSGLQLNSIRMQLENIPLYISEWIFFLVPIVSILGIGALILSSLSRKTKVKIGFLLILGLTMAGAIALSSKIIAGRYSFPVLWVVFLILFILSLWRWKKLFIPSALSMIIPITSFFTPDPSRFHLWPTLFRREVYSSGSTVFVGSPLFQWILTNGPSKESNICIYLKGENGEMGYYVNRALVGVFQTKTIFPESDLKEYEKCEGTHLYFQRQYLSIPENCDLPCSERAKRSCSIQPVDEFSLDGHHTPDLPGRLTNGACFDEK